MERGKTEWRKQRTVAAVFFRTFGVLPEVHFLHSIYHFKAQEVKNPMLQTVRNSDLKWRSYSHCKPITPSWRKNFAQRCEITLCCEMISQPFCTVFWNSSWSYPIYAAHWKLRTSRWKTTSQRCGTSLLLRSNFAALFVPAKSRIPYFHLRNGP